ncbi:MAG: acyl-ACP--UDP-N-acetylglucosamine O-acyltransferase [Candidatus Comchoanobacterales bacterium]
MMQGSSMDLEQQSITRIHPTAIISPGASIAEDVHIGPYCVVGEQVTLKSGVTLKSHVVVEGNTTINECCVIHPFAVIGSAPQDLKFLGESSEIHIGCHTVIREHVTIHGGTLAGGQLTSVGNHCLLMVGAHIAHDCRVGHHVVMANNATLGGHVTVGDHAVIGGLAGVHQWVHIGAFAMIGFLSRVQFDVIPYGALEPKQTYLSGINWVGVKRSGMSKADQKVLKNAFELIFKAGEPISISAKKALNTFQDNVSVSKIISFILSQRKRNLCVPK